MTRINETAKVRASELLAVAAAIAAGTQAYAEEIIFINPAEGEPGHFDWDLGGEFEATTWLDITRPSTDQGGLVGPSSVGQIMGGMSSAYVYNGTAGGAFVFAAAGPFHATKALDAGESIDSSLTDLDNTFSDTSLHVIRFLSKFPPYFFTASSFAPFPSYMGARFNDVDGYHYGWIGVVLHGLDLDAFAWGYETEPGVPISAGIPAPGTLAALAFGAVVTRRGRKREDD